MACLRLLRPYRTCEPRLCGFRAPSNFPRFVHGRRHALANVTAVESIATTFVATHDPELLLKKVACIK
jgi:hypothetical protein